MAKEQLMQIIDRDKEELFALLGSLIQINSENFGPHGNEQEIAAFIQSYCRDMGYRADIYSPMELPDFENHPDYLKGRHLENRYNCTVTVPGASHEKKLMLAGHLDTVEIGDETKWDFPPLLGQVRDGRVLGRGACDDKYAVATSLFLIKKLKELGISLNYDLLFSAYCDEEHGGSNGALAAVLKYPCDDYLNLDCKGFEIWNSGVGGGGVRFTVSSREPMDNCSRVLAGLRVVEKHMESFCANRRKELAENPIFTGTIVARNAYRIMSYAAGGSGGMNMDTGNFKITYYTDKQEPVIQAELDAMKAAADAELEALGLYPLRIEKTTRFFHYVEGERNNPVIDLLKKAGAENGMEMPVKGACLSDFPMFVMYGNPKAVCFGLGGDFDQPGGAHQANECVNCDDLVKFTKIVGAFLMDYQA